MKKTISTILISMIVISQTGHSIESESNYKLHNKYLNYNLDNYPYATASGYQVSNDDDIEESIYHLQKRAQILEKEASENVTQKSFYDIKSLAEQGNALYQAKLAIIYEKGIEVRQDHKKAVEWYRKSADQGYSPSEFLLGSKYYKGEGVRHSYKTAIYWFLKAANNQEEPLSEAKALLGIMYELGQGVKANKIVAKEWYGKACDSGDQAGCDQYRRLNLYHN